MTFNVRPTGTWEVFDEDHVQSLEVYCLWAAGGAESMQNLCRHTFVAAAPTEHKQYACAFPLVAKTKQWKSSEWMKHPQRCAQISLADSSSKLPGFSHDPRRTSPALLLGFSCWMPIIIYSRQVWRRSITGRSKEGKLDRAFGQSSHGKSLPPTGFS